MRASLVIPVYNEEMILRQNTETLIGYLDQTLDDYEVLLIENGSRDNTAKQAWELELQNQRIHVYNIPEPCLGEAIKTGVINSRFEKVVYYPIDLSVNLDFIPEATRLLGSYDVVVGSKRLRTARDQRPTARKLASKGYHNAVKLLFHTDLSDTTCVKGYRRETALQLMNLVPSGSNVFETEVLLEAQKQGLKVAQVPVVVDDQRIGRLPLRYKVASKGQDLLSLRIDMLSLVAGGLMLLSGLACIGFLSLQKLVFNREGFLNPYSFLLSMLLVLFGAQGIAYGLFARLFLQLRREITSNNNRLVSGNVFKEEGK